MKDLRLTVTINKPAHEVFAFTTDPTNTPKWIDAIVVEETNEWPAKLRTTYRNQNTAGVWREFVMTSFEPGKSFTLTSKDGYHVRYTCNPLDAHTTQLEYYEWMDEGELHDVLTAAVLEKLKRTIET